MQPLWHFSAAEIAALIKLKTVSAREVALAALERLDAVNPAINAVVDHRPDDALAQADAVDQALSRGEELPPLAGVPVTVKVNADQVGYANTNGVRLQRDNIAQADNPAVANLKKAGAVIVGRTNTPAFSYRWFTSNLLHGETRNPRNPAITPGGSSGGAGAAVATGIGCIAHGTDIAGSIRYPAYACGVHGLRPTLGRVPVVNPSLPERPIGPQLMAVTGPLARTMRDLRLALAAMSARDMRDPWWMPVPLDGPPVPLRAALCINPDGLDPAPDVRAAVADAGKRLEEAGWSVEQIEATPPLREAAEHQVKLWMGDGYAAQLAAAEREGDRGALAALRGQAAMGRVLDLAGFSAALTRRATLAREWSMFFEDYAVLVLPVSGELPFPNALDLKDEASYARVWHAQMPQVGIPFMGLPALTVSTGLVGATPVGVQVVSQRFREDLCLVAGEAIALGGTPPMPIDPV